jgi:predicted Ser/Thr protein kinase
MAEAGCPQDEELLPLATREPGSDRARSHLDSCASCRQRVDRLQAEVETLRQAAQDTPALSAVQPDEAASVVAQLPTTDDWKTREGVVPVSPPWPPAETPMGSLATVGKYILVAPLDEGGQAQVFRAIHPTLGKELVVKLGHGATVSAASRNFLVKEGKLLADLDHPNLARIYDLDFHEGRPFLVMEYVRGRNLHQYAKQERPTPRQAAGIVAQVARALAVAHARGIAHLDIKPKNILIDETSRARLIDFGLARMQFAGESEAEARGPICGTPSYMAPEQARGETAKIDQRSDVFALGGVLYFLLAGKPPFKGSTLRETLELAGRGELDRQALRAVRTPRRLEAICLRALATDPAERYARVEDLAADLERFVRRPRQLAALLVGLVLLGLIGLGTIWLLRQVGTPAIPTGYPTLHVYRNGLIFELKDALPVHTGEHAEIRCQVPHGFHTALFWRDSEGSLVELTPFAIAPARPFDELLYPDEPGAVVPITGKSGTELVLVCARRSTPISRTEVAPEFDSDGPWPVLPAWALVRLNQDGVDAGRRLRSVGAPVVPFGSVAEVEERMERLRLKLRDRFEFVAGLAFPHHD